MNTQPARHFERMYTGLYVQLDAVGSLSRTD
jgi:hypothetical protein